MRQVVVLLSVVSVSIMQNISNNFLCWKGKRKKKEKNELMLLVVAVFVFDI